MSRILRSNIILILVLLIISCKSNEIFTSGSVSNISDAKLRHSLLEHDIVYNKLYSKKLNVTFTDNKTKKNFKASYVIKKDSVIVVSIMAVMGIEVVRAQFKPDSITIIDKHNKKVFLTDYTFFLDKYDIDINFNILQGLLTNTTFAYPPSSITTDDCLKKYKHGYFEDLYTFGTVKSKRLNRLSKKDDNELLFHDMIIFPEIYRINKHTIKDFTTNYTLDIVYSNFIKYNNILFPKSVVLNAIRSNKSFTLILETNHIELNKGGSLHFKIPSSYEVSNM